MPTLSKVMVVAGEASGDLHAAKLVNAIRAELPDANIEFFGCAGPRMREAGVDAVVKADGLSIVGLPEIARSLPVFTRAMRDLKNAAAARQPDVVILVDFPEFNLKLARFLKQSGHKVVYYISPQLWAWRRYRIGTIRKYVDLMITILPFEKAWYAEHGVGHVEFVGSPLAMEVRPSLTKTAFCRKHGIDAAGPVAALLPGSRNKEISRILPVMLDAAALLERSIPEVQFMAAVGTPAAASQARSIIAGHAIGSRIKIILNETYDALNAADVAAVTSGTATLEAGIIGTPMAIVYKTSTLNYRLLRPLISVTHFGLINLIAEDRIVKELIQDDFTPTALSTELMRLLEPETNADIREKLKNAVAKLGSGGASKRAAKLIIERFDF